MRRLRIAAVSAIVTFAGALCVLPAPAVGAQPASPGVLIPSDNATVAGTSQILDSVAPSGTAQVQYEITGGTLTDSVVATATSTLYGWVADWNTTTVPNGIYSLESVVSSRGAPQDSPVITITVDNVPPSTTVVLPSDGATLSGLTEYLDSTASSGVTQVQYELSGGTLSGQVIATATPTIVGSAAVWNTTTVSNGS